MLIENTETWGHYDEDDDGNEIEVNYTKTHSVIVPGCCEASSKEFAITLGFDYDAKTDSYSDEPSWQANTNWELARKIVGSRQEYAGIEVVSTETHYNANGTPYESKVCRSVYKDRWPKYKPKVCPFCATPLPAIRKRANPPEKVWDGDDYYCGTCEERNMNCLCRSPITLWEVVPNE